MNKTNTAARRLIHSLIAGVTVFTLIVCVGAQPVNAIDSSADSSQNVSSDSDETSTASSADTTDSSTLTTKGMKVNNLIISVSNKGFHPSKNNYVLVRSNISLTADSSSVQMTITNNKGKIIRQKTIKKCSSGNGCFSYKWDGKYNGKYVKSGKYKIEIAVWNTDGTIEVTKNKTKSLIVSKKAKSGTQGVAAAVTQPVYTGFDMIDYMAEDMLKKAGVKNGMSADAKVKNIYHWMTRNFKHVHYTDQQSNKEYYKLKKLEKKISKYKKSSDAKMNKGKIVYSYDSAALWEVSSMVYRNGVCDDHAEIFRILCNHAGIEAGRCGGYYKNRSGSLSPHAWCYAIVNGNKYYYDIDVEIQNYGKGQGDYYWYKKTKTQAKKTHKFLSEEKLVTSGFTSDNDDWIMSV